MTKKQREAGQGIRVQAALIQMGNTVEDGQPGFYLDEDFIPYTEKVMDSWVELRERAEGNIKAGTKGAERDYKICDAVVDRLWYDGQYGLQRGMIK